MRIILNFLPLLLVFFSLTTANSKDKYVFLITIDGLRPDAISGQTSPNLAKLIEKSSYSLKAKTVYPSTTMPSHTSLFTGLDAKNHKNTLNDYRVINKLLDHGKYITLETIFTLAEKKKIRTTFICGKNKIRFLIKPHPENQIFCYDIYSNNDKIVQNITAKFISSFKRNKNVINIIHYPEPDSSGHKHGWMTDEYLESLKEVDIEIEKLISLINSELPDDKYLVIITADHGGTEKGHRTKSKEHMTIPWIAYGNSVKKDYEIQKEVKIYDTAPTILNFLDIKTPSTLDVNAVTEIFN